MRHRIAHRRTRPPRFLGSLACAGLFTLLFLAPSVRADDDSPPFIPFFPFQISIAPAYAQIMPANVPIWGVALNAIYGLQHEVIGLDVGLFNEVERNLMGPSIGVANITRGEAVGLQAGMGNAAEGGFRGAQLAAINFAEGDFVGVQLGAGNTGENVKGLQLGIINHADELDGVQFGLLNFNGSGPIYFLPFVNVGW